MNKSILIAVLAALLLTGSARAEEKPAPSARQSLMTFFRHLKSSLEKSSVQGERKRARGASSVAAVRGAGQYSELADPNETTLKGSSRAKRNKAAMAEDAEFEKAVSLILAGKNDEGVKALEAFKVKYPKSRSLDSVDEAIAKAKELAAAQAEAPKDEKPAEEPKAE
ncbi:MAG: hypothetical protein A2506_12305 [Elusimicrobia bacterium RIFOXYD12_FULL_66_9]|nr:MAG: hypothetical protein A2506_12305 [Elusimicrobia bacterium RIFOXYD12_FULL_66_9]